MATCTSVEVQLRRATAPPVASLTASATSRSCVDGRGRSLVARGVELRSSMSDRDDAGAQRRPDLDRARTPMPPTPCTASHSPARSEASCWSACHAVMNRHPRASAASTTLYRQRDELRSAFRTLRTPRNPRHASCQETRARHIDSNGPLGSTRTCRTPRQSHRHPVAGLDRRHVLADSGHGAREACPIVIGKAGASPIQTVLTHLCQSVRQMPSNSTCTTASPGPGWARPRPRSPAARRARPDEPPSRAAPFRHRHPSRQRDPTASPRHHPSRQRDPTASPRHRRPFAPASSLFRATATPSRQRDPTASPRHRHPSRQRDPTASPRHRHPTAPPAHDVVEYTLYTASDCAWDSAAAEPSAPRP